MDSFAAHCKDLSAKCHTYFPIYTTYIYSNHIICSAWSASLFTLINFSSLSLLVYQIQILNHFLCTARSIFYGGLHVSSVARTQLVPAPSLMAKIHHVVCGDEMPTYFFNVYSNSDHNKGLAHPKPFSCSGEREKVGRRKRTNEEC